jgi:4-alpha-glucanotransferase
MWRDNALKRLRALMKASPMLTCGEDLGMIPACVAEVMESERILSLEIERMPKQFGVEFGATEQYPYLSVAATSTHDMSTIRGWWEEGCSIAQRYWRDVLHRTGEAEESCSATTAYDILSGHMRSRSMLAILPLQDWLAVDESLRLANPAAERINVPADANHYWRYRMHLTLEELLSADEFNPVVADLVAQRKC